MPRWRRLLVRCARGLRRTRSGRRGCGIAFGSGATPRWARPANIPPPTYAQATPVGRAKLLGTPNVIMAGLGIPNDDAQADEWTAEVAALPAAGLGNHGRRQGRPAVCLRKADGPGPPAGRKVSADRGRAPGRHEQRRHRQGFQARAHPADSHAVGGGPRAGQDLGRPLHDELRPQGHRAVHRRAGRDHAGRLARQGPRSTWRSTSPTARRLSRASRSCWGSTCTTTATGGGCPRI